LSSASLAGVYLGSVIVPSVPFVLLAVALAVVFALLFYPDRRKSILAMLCLAALLFGVFRFQSSRFVLSEDSVAFYNNTGSHEIRGMVAGDPEPRDASVDLRLSVEAMRLEEDWRSVYGLILARVPRLPDYRYGDVLKLSGRLEAPPQFDGFDYRSYLARQGIHSTMRYPKVELLARGQGFKPLEWVYELRNALSFSLTTILPEPQAALAQGMLLGIRTSIPEELNEAFSRAGTMHIIAISGHNISVVAGLFLILGIYLFGRHRPFYFVFALAGIWLYSLLAGMAPSVQRAVLMGSLWLTADFIGRPRSALPALLLSAAVLVGVTPDLLWDVAFQLSFAAMGGLIIIAPSLLALGRKWSGDSVGGESPSYLNMVVDSLAVTLGTTLATMPIIAANFQRIPLLAPLANLMALPALPPIIVTNAFAASAGLVYPPLGQLLGWLAWPFLTYLIAVAESFSSLPLASLEMAWGSGYYVIAYYLLLGAIIWLSAQGNRSRLDVLKSGTAGPAAGNGSSRGVSRLLNAKSLVIALSVVCLLVWVPVLLPREGKLRVSFLDVGQGDAILIQTPSNRKILIDGGPSPQAISAQLSKKLAFWDRTVDMVVLTHPDDDHVTGLAEVLRRYQVRTAIDTGMKSPSPAYRDCLELVAKKKIDYVLAGVNQRVRLGGDTVVEVLHPQAQFLSG
ncbi:MAG: ComEC/Rec2 family competence protein, partial [Chloroflexota bacterium]